MKKLYQFIMIITFSILVLNSCSDLNGKRFYGFEIPTDSAIIFASGIICLEERFEQSITFIPDGSEIVFGISNQNWDVFKMHSIKYENGRWSDSKEVFSNGTPGGIAPMFSPDGSKLYHSTTRTGYPEMDIYYTSKQDTGWAEAMKLDFPISSDSIEWEASVSTDHTIYFSSAREGCQGPLDIFFSELEDGRYKTANRMSDKVNSTAGDDCPFIAPDESYIIFASDRDDSFGKRDLYISFKNNDGSWSQALNLGPKVNTEFWEIYPSVSPDGEFLFFTRREKWWESAPSDIYWISTDFLKTLR